MSKRLLFVSSSRFPWYAKGTSAAAHFAAAPYSIDAIGYNLERMGWTVAWLGWRDTAAKGAMMLFRREVVADTGFLFYDHFGSFFEETDFCRRAANCGWETWFVPTPPIDHLCGATSARFDRDAIWVQYFRNILYSFARNWGWWGRRVMLPAFACAAFVRSPRNLIRALKREMTAT